MIRASSFKQTVHFTANLRLPETMLIYRICENDFTEEHSFAHVNNGSQVLYEVKSHALHGGETRGWLNWSRGYHLETLALRSRIDSVYVSIQNDRHTFTKREVFGKPWFAFE